MNLFTGPALVTGHHGREVCPDLFLIGLVGQPAFHFAQHGACGILTYGTLGTHTVPSADGAIVLLHGYHNQPGSPSPGHAARQAFHLALHEMPAHSFQLAGYNEGPGRVPALEPSAGTAHSFALYFPVLVNNRLALYTAEVGLRALEKLWVREKTPPTQC